MFKIKAIKGLDIKDTQLRFQGYKWRVVEEKFDGTEEEYGVFCIRVKAQLVAQLLNETALVEAK